MADHLGPDLDEFLPQRCQRPTPDRLREHQLPQEVGQVVGQGEQVQSRLIILEPSARQLRPVHRVLPFLDPLFRRPPLVVEADHTLRTPIQVGDDAADPREQFTGMPGALDHHAAGLILRTGPVTEVVVEHRRLVRRPTHRATDADQRSVCVGDITYIPPATRTSNGRFGYLALLMDLCSRRIVGWEYGTSMSEELVLGALRRAIQERQPRVGLIHHTDRGGQYASRRYRDVLRRSAMQPSMSAAESYYDNAFMESCIGTVKTELELVEYANNSEAVRKLSNYIRYYNGSRRHSSLEYVSPAAFESQLTAQK